MEIYPKILISGDYNIFKQENYNSAGVYGFSGIMHSNSFITPIYIGSSADLKQRITEAHLPQIRNNRHKNPPLVNYINKYGLENIIIFQMSVTAPTKEALITSEQKFIDYYGIAAKGQAFNISPKAGSRLGCKESPETVAKKRAKTVSPETRAKISAANKGKKLNLTPEQREQRSLRQKGEKHWNWGRKSMQAVQLGKSWEGKKQSEEHKRKRAEKLAKPFRLIDPNGNLIEGTNLARFARENGLCEGHLNSVVNGKRPSHKGYRTTPIIMLESSPCETEKICETSYLAD